MGVSALNAEGPRESWWHKNFTRKQRQSKINQKTTVSLSTRVTPQSGYSEVRGPVTETNGRNLGHWRQVFAEIGTLILSFIFIVSHILIFSYSLSLSLPTPLPFPPVIKWTGFLSHALTIIFYDTTGAKLQSQTTKSKKTLWNHHLYKCFLLSSGLS